MLASLEAKSRQLPKAMESEPHPGGNYNGKVVRYRIRTTSKADIERAAQICQDAFEAFYVSYSKTSSLPPRERDDLVGRVVSFQVNHHSISHLSAVSVDGNDDEVEIIGSNRLDYRDPVASVRILSVALASEAHGVGRVLMDTIVDKSEKVARTRTTCLIVAGRSDRAFSLYSSQAFKVVE